MKMLLALALFAAQDNTPPFEDRAWTLTELNGAKLTPRKIPHMRFAKGRVTGNGGCNQFFGSYQSQGDMLKIDKIGSTMMACAPPEIEQPTMKALSGTVRYRIVRDTLELLSKDGKVLARLVAK